MIFTPSDVSSLSQSLHHWEIAEYIFEGLVIIACAGELVAELGRKCLTRARRDRIGLLSTILLVAALSMELICLVKTNELSGRVIGSLSDKAEAADSKAQSAVDKSSLAEKKADGEAKQADALTLRMESATGQLNQLEKNLAGQGPRAKLLVKAAPELAPKLSPFAGQRVGLFVCGQQGLADQETIDTWAAIANILDAGTVLGVAGAKWKLVPTNLNFTGGCGAARGLGQGVIVFVSKSASRGTMEAANALGHGIAETLPPSSNKMPSLVDPDFAKLTIDRGFQDKNAPWVSPGLDADLITVLIGAHP
jgi:hypothetical protein